MREACFIDALDHLFAAFSRIKLSQSRHILWSPWLLDGIFRVEERRIVSVAVTVCQREGSRDAESPINLYKRAFLLSMNDEELAASQQAGRLMEVIILFNMGLCLHAMALSLGTESSAGLISASKAAYLDAFSLLNPETTSTHHDRLLRLALCNNIGHVCAYMCQFREAENFLQMLKQYLICFQANDNGKGPLDDTLFDFYYNAIAVHGTYHLAPAA